MRSYDALKAIVDSVAKTAGAPVASNAPAAATSKK
jgi:hypothetical protein